MANKLYDDTAIQNIANAIRTKNGLSDTYKVSEMSNAILSLDYSIPSKAQRCTVSEYAAMQSHDQDTMYLVYTFGKYGMNTGKIYFGDDLVYPPHDSTHEFFYRSVFFPDSNATDSIGSSSYFIETGLCIDGDNNERDFELTFKATRSSNASFSEQVIIGTGSDSVLRELYYSGDNLKLASTGYGDSTIVSNCWGHEITLKRTNNGTTLEIYDEGVLVNTITIVKQTGVDTLGLGRYNTTQRLQGTIDYIKFKWLS